MSSNIVERERWKKTEKDSEDNVRVKVENKSTKLKNIATHRM